MPLPLGLVYHGSLRNRHLLGLPSTLLLRYLDIEIQVVESFQRFILACLDPENLVLMILPVFQRFFLYIGDGSSA